MPVLSNQQTRWCQWLLPVVFDLAPCVDWSTASVPGLRVIMRGQGFTAVGTDVCCI